MYRCTVNLTTYVAVEAESLAEAERIIDGVLHGCDEVHIHEDGGIDHGGDTLVGSRSNISRGRIMVEN
jgi:Icc-related predicted phosphoesterase